MNHMAYHLLTYSLIFLPVVIALYQLCPARFRFVVLLAADYTFFCMISGKLLVWLLLATLVTYGTGRWLAAIPVRHSDLHGKALTRKKRGVLALGIVLILGALVTLKYLRVFGVTLAAPIGISYYSLQAISYMTDVYRGTQESCKNPIKVALYLSFFPQIMEGPISRFSETADALYGGNSIQFENLVFGYQRIIWGLFKKMVIADRLAPLVSKVFSNYNNFDGAAILVGVLAYTMQLYMEFSGCMDIVIGSAVSKFVAPTIALFFVWLSNGIWHGPHMNYIFYGMYYFMLIVIENLTEEPCRKLVERFKLDTECIGFRIFQFLKLFVIVNIGEMFFRADTVATGFRMLRGIVTDFHITALAETNFGVDVPDLILASVSILLVFVVDIIHEKGISIRRKVADCKLPVRWSFWYAVVLLVVVFGAYGSGYTIVDMIYAAY